MSLPILISSFVGCGASSPPPQTQTASAVPGHPEAPEAEQLSAPEGSTSRSDFVTWLRPVILSTLCNGSHDISTCFELSANECRQRMSDELDACEESLPEYIENSTKQEWVIKATRCASEGYVERADSQNHRRSLSHCLVQKKEFGVEVKKEADAMCADPKHVFRACFSVSEEECSEGFMDAFDHCAESMPDQMMPAQWNKESERLGECAGAKYIEVYGSRMRPCPDFDNP